MNTPGGAGGSCAGAEALGHRAAGLCQAGPDADAVRRVLLALSDQPFEAGSPVSTKAPEDSALTVEAKAPAGVVQGGVGGSAGDSGGSPRASSLQGSSEDGSRPGMAEPRSVSRILAVETPEVRADTTSSRGVGERSGSVAVLDDEVSEEVQSASREGRGHGEAGGSCRPNGREESGGACDDGAAACDRCSLDTDNRGMPGGSQRDHHQCGAAGWKRPTQGLGEASLWDGRTNILLPRSARADPQQTIEHQHLQALGPRQSAPEDVAPTAKGMGWMLVPHQGCGSRVADMG